MNKKGISMVALVITIIVLIILTGAVVMTGLNAPTNASEAVDNYNKTVVQDAVTVYIMNKIAEAALDVSGANYTSVEAIVNTMVDANDKIKLSAADLGLSGIDVSVYSIDENGKVQ